MGFTFASCSNSRFTLRYGFSLLLPFLVCDTVPLDAGTMFG
jgi:hypothetical protein